MLKTILTFFILFTGFSLCSQNLTIRDAKIRMQKLENLIKSQETRILEHTQTIDIAILRISGIEERISKIEENLAIATEINKDMLVTYYESADENIRNEISKLRVQAIEMIKNLSRELIALKKELRIHKEDLSRHEYIKNIRLESIAKTKLIIEKLKTIITDEEVKSSSTRAKLAEYEQRLKELQDKENNDS